MRKWYPVDTILFRNMEHSSSCWQIGESRYNGHPFFPINLTTVFYKLKLAPLAFPAVVVVEPVTPLIAKKDTLL
jgi:hypothetical protein